MSPFPASKAFSNGIDNIVNSSDNTRVLKTKTLYNFFSKNHWKLNNNATNTSQGTGVSLTKKNGSVYKGPVIIDNKGCLSSVGGFNNENYQMLFDIARGSYLSNTNCVTGENSNNMIYSNYNIDNNCINERALNKYFDQNSNNTICRIPDKTRELWEATFNNVSLQQNCIEPHFSYNMGLNKCQNISSDDYSQTYTGSTFHVDANSNIWLKYKQQDNNLNYITWPIPTVESNNPGVFFTERALSACPKCNGGSLPYRNNNDNICILEKYSNWNLDLICNYNFGGLTNNKKSLKSFNLHKISMNPSCFFLFNDVHISSQPTQSTSPTQVLA